MSSSGGIVSDHDDLSGVSTADHHGDNAHAGLILSGTVAARPAAATLDRYYWATDEHILYRDTGAAWVKAAGADLADLDGVLTDGQIPAAIARDAELHGQAHAIDGGDHAGVLTDGQIPAAIARDSELHAQAHPAASHSDQEATGSELEELTDGSETVLHSHAGGAVSGAAFFVAGQSDWTQPGWGWESYGWNSILVDELYYIPIFMERAITFVRIGLHVNNAGAGGSVVRLGIYAATVDGNGSIQPDTLTLDAGTVAVDTTGAKEIVISQALAAGYHFLAFSSDGAPQLRGPASGAMVWAPVTAHRQGIGINVSFPVARVSVVDGAAALPDPAPAATNIEAILQAHAILRR